MIIYPSTPKVCVCVLFTIHFFLFIPTLYFTFYLLTMVDGSPKRLTFNRGHADASLFTLSFQKKGRKKKVNGHQFLLYLSALSFHHPLFLFKGFFIRYPDPQLEKKIVKDARHANEIRLRSARISFLRAGFSCFTIKVSTISSQCPLP